MWRNGLIAFLSISFSYMVGLLTMGTWFILWPVGFWSRYSLDYFFLVLCDVHDLLYLLSILDLGLIFLGLSPQPVSACEWCLVSRALGSEFSVFMFVRVWLRRGMLFSSSV